MFFLAEKTVLIVYAHQNPKSFNCAVKDTAVKAFTDQGCKVMVSDLYAMKFRAEATADDIKGQQTFSFYMYIEMTKLTLICLNIWDGNYISAALQLRYCDNIIGSEDWFDSSQMKLNNIDYRNISGW